mmetsp:Transcript_95583/g.276058  ORF Transcript_95583/g.276058 Transcript_95583/m.276058 type:complete len:227 (-) Transcript_95583:13-693(-)
MRARSWTRMEDTSMSGGDAWKSSSSSSSRCEPSENGSKATMRHSNSARSLSSSSLPPLGTIPTHSSSSSSSSSPSSAAAGNLSVGKSSASAGSAAGFRRGAGGTSGQASSHSSAAEGGNAKCGNEHNFTGSAAGQSRGALGGERGESGRSPATAAASNGQGPSSTKSCATVAGGKAKPKTTSFVKSKGSAAGDNRGARGHAPDDRSPHIGWRRDWRALVPRCGSAD